MLHSNLAKFSSQKEIKLYFLSIYNISLTYAAVVSAIEGYSNKVTHCLVSRLFEMASMVSVSSFSLNEGATVMVHSIIYDC